jgi:hypothetical protein
VRRPWLVRDLLLPEYALEGPYPDVAADPLDDEDDDDYEEEFPFDSDDE